MVSNLQFVLPCRRFLHCTGSPAATFDCFHFIISPNDVGCFAVRLRNLGDHHGDGFVLGRNATRVQLERPSTSWRLVPDPCADKGVVARICQRDLARSDAVVRVERDRGENVSPADSLEDHHEVLDITALRANRDRDLVRLRVCLALGSAKILFVLGDGLTQLAKQLFFVFFSLSDIGNKDGF